jgi:hypothetical protein
MKLDTSATTMTVVGAGGTQQLAVGPIDWFECGQHRFEKPVVMCSLASCDPFAGGNIEGNIGVEFLKPFGWSSTRETRMSLALLKLPKIVQNGAERSIRPHFAEQPGSGKHPVTLGGRQGNTHRFSRFFQRESAEVMKFDHPCPDGIERFKRLQSPIQRQ